MPRVVYPWQPHEVALIVDKCATHTAKQLADLLDGKRTRSAIKDKLKRMGLRPLRDPVFHYNPNDETYMLLHGPHQPAEDTAKHLGLSTVAVIKKAQRMNLSLGKSRNKRRWTEQEDDHLQRYYLLKTCAVLAKELNRTVSSIQNRLKGQGISFEHDDRATWEPKIRELHAQGYTDAEIGKVLCRSCSTIKHRRETLLGLPVQRSTEIGRQRWSERCRKQMKKTLDRNGFDGLHEALATKRMAAIIKTGWQYANTLSEVMILDILEQDGWQTKYDLSDKTKLTIDSTRQILYHLHKRGLIVLRHDGWKVQYRLADGMRRSYSLRATHRGKEKNPRGPSKRKGQPVPQHREGGQPEGSAHQGCGGAHNDELRGSGEVCPVVLPGVQQQQAGVHAACAHVGIDFTPDGALIEQGRGTN